MRILDVAQVQEVSGGKNHSKDQFKKKIKIKIDYKYKEKGNIKHAHDCNQKPVTNC